MFYFQRRSIVILFPFLFNKSSTKLKILVIFSDGNSEDENGDVQDTFWLEKTAKLLRVDNNIKMVGVLIPNTQNTQRIQELNGIFSEPNDAIDVAFSDDNLNGIADSLFARVRRLVCRGKNLILIHMDSILTIKHWPNGNASGRK